MLLSTVLPENRHRGRKDHAVCDFTCGLVDQRWHSGDPISMFEIKLEVTATFVKDDPDPQIRDFWEKHLNRRLHTLKRRSATSLVEFWTDAITLSARRQCLRKFPLIGSNRQKLPRRKFAPPFWRHNLTWSMPTKLSWSIFPRCNT